MLHDEPDVAVVVAARAGDPRAVDALVTGYLPLLYNVVGRALNGHADVDDLVQETMVRALHALPTLREPARFRSWLVAIAIHLVRDRYRDRQGSRDTARQPDEVADPGADFVDLSISRLGLSGQRREIAEATRWLEPDDRDLLSLWWLEVAGALSREELADALGLSRQHAAVRVQRMKAQLDTARAVVRALHDRPLCPGLEELRERWDGRPGPLWRKRFARHLRDCDRCSGAWSGMVTAERLLGGLALVPVPAAMLPGTGAEIAAPAGDTTSGAGVTASPAPAGPAAASPRVASLSAAGHPGLVAVLVVAVIAAVAGVAYVVAPPRESARFVPSAAAVGAATTAPGPSPVTSSAVSAPPAPSVAASKTVTPAVPSSAPATKPARRSAKKGVGAYHFAGVNDAMRDVRASWYYNWRPTNAHLGAPGVEFVPMIRDAADVNDDDLRDAKSQGRVLLGFNEPDRPNQANMSVQQALDLWPRLMATGMRLGSPAVSWGADEPGMWLDEFMTGAARRGYRVDFITVHAYQGDFSDAAVGKMERYLKRVHQRYGLPIWVTEYAMVNFSRSPNVPSNERQAAFATASCAMLERLRFVERYAWFALPAREDGDGTGLYRDGDTPTAVGRAYRAAG